MLKCASDLEEIANEKPKKIMKQEMKAATLFWPNSGDKLQLNWINTSEIESFVF